MFPHVNYREQTIQAHARSTKLFINVNIAHVCQVRKRKFQQQLHHPTAINSLTRSHRAWGGEGGGGGDLQVFTAPMAAISSIYPKHTDITAHWHKLHFPLLVYNLRQCARCPSSSSRSLSLHLWSLSHVDLAEFTSTTETIGFKGWGQMDIMSTSDKDARFLNQATCYT